MHTIRFLIFVSRKDGATLKTVEFLKSAFKHNKKYQALFEIIDITSHPEAAEKHQILATPTIIKAAENSKRVVGHVNNIKVAQQIIQLFTEYNEH